MQVCIRFGQHFRTGAARRAMAKSRVTVGPARTCVCVCPCSRWRECTTSMARGACQACGAQRQGHRSVTRHVSSDCRGVGRAASGSSGARDCVRPRRPRCGLSRRARAIVSVSKTDGDDAPRGSPFTEAGWPSGLRAERQAAKKFRANTALSQERVWSAP